jgi:cyclase
MSAVRSLVLTATVIALAWTATYMGAPQRAANDEIRILPLRNNIFMLSGAGSNVVASIGRDGVLLVDTGAAEMGEKTLAVIRELSRQVTSSPMPQQSCVGLVHCQWWDGSKFLGTTASPPAPRPIIGVVNTSFDPDHMGGNAVIVNAGKSYGAREGEGAWVIAHENAPKHVAQRSVPSAALPTETYFGTDKKLNFVNGEAVVIWHQPAAHTDGDSMVQFRASEVLAVGDILNMANYPVIDIEKGGSVQGVIESLNWILDIAVVEHMMEGGTMIIPGHGRVTDSADVAYYRDMVTIVRDRVREMIKRGMTLPQIQSAKLTRDYDGRFGRNPAWTPAMFVEAVYRSVNAKAKD